MLEEKKDWKKTSEEKKRRRHLCRHRSPAIDFYIDFFKPSIELILLIGSIVCFKIGWHYK